jgi:hypothetical protein
VVLILMTVSISLALYTVSVSRDIVATSKSLMDNLQARIESGSTLEQVKYIGSTGRFSAWNLANLSGQKEFPQQMNLRGGAMAVANCELRLQDTAGKLGLWAPNLSLLSKMLAANGVRSNEIAVACDSLLDLVDADDLKQLNGAETWYYRSERGAAYRPRNDRFIQTRGELELVKGFRGKVFDLVREEMVDTGVPTFNVNTADAPLLAAAFDVALPTAQGLVQLRDRKGFLTQTDLLASGANGLTFADESFISFPSKKVVVDIRTRVNEAGDSLKAIISFQPGKERPFTVEKLDE